MLLRLFIVLTVYFQHMLVRITQAPNGADLRFLTPSLQQPSSWQVIDALADCTARGFIKDFLQFRNNQLFDKCYKMLRFIY